MFAGKGVSGGYMRSSSSYAGSCVLVQQPARRRAHPEQAQARPAAAVHHGLADERIQSPAPASSPSLSPPSPARPKQRTQHIARTAH